MIFEKLKLNEQPNATILGVQSSKAMINFFHILSLIHSETTRKHTSEFVLYKTQEFLKDAIPWVNLVVQVDDEMEKGVLDSIASNVKLFQENEENVNKIIEFVTINLMYTDPNSARFDVLDYVTVLLSLISHVYGYSLDQIFDF